MGIPAMSIVHIKNMAKLSHKKKYAPGRNLVGCLCKAAPKDLEGGIHLLHYSLTTYFYQVRFILLDLGYAAN